MKKLNAYEVRSEFYTIYNVDTNDIINNIGEYGFNSILYDPKLEIEEGLLIFTDEKRPISIGYDYVYKNYLGINPIYYEKNREEIDKMLLVVAKEVKTSYLQIDKEFVNEGIKDALIRNDKIKTLVIDGVKVR